MTSVIANYVIHLDNGQQSAELEYEILDNPISRVWCNLVSTHLADPRNTIPYKSQWFKDIYVNNVETRCRYWTELRTLVIQLNDTVDFLDLPVPVEFEEINLSNPANAILNFLHYEFHRLEEQGLKHPALGRLNMLIHETEELFTAGKINNLIQYPRAGFYLQTPSFLNYIDFDTNVEENASYWNYIPNYGDLTIGYHTVGKNIYHCCVNDDVSLVKSDMVRPQKNISTETVLTFSKLPVTKERALEKMRGRVLDWVSNNNLTQYIDMARPEHNLFGQPLIGRLKGNYTQNEILNILQIKNFSSVRLLNYTPGKLA